jgi:hypothetical protein
MIRASKPSPEGGRDRGRWQGYRYSLRLVRRQGAGEPAGHPARSGQATTLSGVPDRIDHKFAAELGANGLPGWLGGFTDREERRTVQEIEEMRR